MQLLSVTIKNFRSYSQPVTIPIDKNLTGITGKNDAGKSSILEALDVYFEGGEISLDRDDFNVASPESPIEISCIFGNLPTTLVLDETNETNLSAEYLTNSDGNFELKKRYKRSALNKPEIIIVSNHPSDESYNDLHSLPLKDLKKRATDLGVSRDTVADARTSSDWRKAIWNSKADLTLQKTELDISKLSTDSKSIQNQIDKLLPLFALFRSDKESSDSAPQAKNPMQEAVKLAQAELRERIEELENEIKSRVLARAANTLEKIKEMDPTLAAQLTPRFKSPPKWTFDFTLDGDQNIPINKRGSGVRRLILLNFFRAEAERRIQNNTSPSVIYAFEEPETSQHPSNQKMLIEAFLEISTKDNCQVIVTTHVPALASMLPTEGLRLVSRDEHDLPSVTFGSESVLNQIADSLGIIPEVGAATAKAIVLVEGPGDIVFLRHACEQLKSAGAIEHTFEEKQIAILPIGGCGSLKHWRTKSIADQFGIPWGILIDSDKGNPNEETKNISQINELQSNGRIAFCLRKREPENYIDPEVIRPHLKNGETDVSWTDTCDAKKIIARGTLTRDENVLEKFWPMMSYDKISQRDRFIDESGAEKYELKEIISSFLGLV